ncbi:MAG: hypothetical protein HRT88_01110 [Lentisphaeraceae bacterium]|nr:hypothetical protein [Lentisphaeraceae bacterium]
MKKKHWSKEEIMLLGTMSDIELAKIIGVATPTVMFKRRDLKVSAYQDKRKWTESEFNIIRQNKNKDAAALLNCSVSTIEKLVEKYELSRENSQKVSSKLKRPKKEPISVKLPPSLIAWLDDQDESRAVVIENACKKLGYK